MATAGHNITDFVARVRETDFARSSRFEVRFSTPGVLGVGGDTKEISLMVEDGLFPGILVGTRPFRINNLNEQRANVIDFGGDAITFTFLVDTTWAAKRFFEDWMTSIINPVTRYVSYPYDYLSEIELVSLNNKDEVIAEWRIQEAFPRSMAPISISATNSEVLRMPVTFAYTKWISIGVDGNADSESESDYINDDIIGDDNIDANADQLINDVENDIPQFEDT
jgi:hypothetical protein